MIIVASWLAWPGFEAFLVTRASGPCHLVQVSRDELTRRLHDGETLAHIVTGVD